MAKGEIKRSDASAESAEETAETANRGVEKKEKKTTEEDKETKQYDRPDDKKRGEKVSKTEEKESRKVLKELVDLIKQKNLLLAERRLVIAAGEEVSDSFNEELVELTDQIQEQIDAARKIVPGLGENIGIIEKKVERKGNELAGSSNPQDYKIDFQEERAAAENFRENGRFPTDHLRALVIEETINQKEEGFAQQVAIKNAEIYRTKREEQRKTAAAHQAATREERQEKERRGEPVRLPPEVSGGAGEAATWLGPEPTINPSTDPKDAVYVKADNFMRGAWIALNASSERNLLQQLGQYQLRMVETMSEFGLGNKGDPNAPLNKYEEFLAKLSAWADSVYAAATEEEKKQMEKRDWRIITSESAEREFLEFCAKIDPSDPDKKKRLPIKRTVGEKEEVIVEHIDRDKAREWVIDKIQKITLAASPDGGFQNSQFAPFQLLQGADNAIRFYGGEMLWQEIHYYFSAYNYGNAIKSAPELKSLIDVAAGVTAETFYVTLNMTGKLPQIDRTKLYEGGVFKPGNVQLNGEFENYAVREDYIAGKSEEEEKTKHQVKIVEIALQHLEKHAEDYAKTHKDNFTTFQKAIAYEMMGYEWDSKKDANGNYREGTALWLARDSKVSTHYDEWPDIMWAVSAAHSVKLAFFTASTIIQDSDTGEDMLSFICYPAGRLANMNQDEDKKLPRFFQKKKDPRTKDGAEGRKWVLPHIDNMWVYAASGALEDFDEQGRQFFGGARLLKKNGNVSLVEAGLLIKVPLYELNIDGSRGQLARDASGQVMYGYVINEHGLENVKFSKVDFNRNEKNRQFQAGLAIKYAVYQNTVDDARKDLTSENDGFFYDPTLENLARIIEKSDPWKKTEQRISREQYYCERFEALIEFRRNRKKTFPEDGEFRKRYSNERSYEERDRGLGNAHEPYEKLTIIRTLRKALDKPFVIPKESVPFRRLMRKYELTYNDLAVAPAPGPFTL